MPMLDLNGSRLYYSVLGEGTPIVFIHPPLISSVVFKSQIDELSKLYKVITFDIRGHGRSSYSAIPISYALICYDIIQLLDHLQIEKAFICGYSTGGSIVLEFLLTNKERALGGISVSGMSEVSDLYNKCRISMGKWLSRKWMIRFLTISMCLGNSQKIEIFKNLYQEARKGDARNIKQYFRQSLQYSCTNRLNTIEAPILLIYGAKDKSFQKYAKLLHEKLPKNELKFIDQKHQIPTKSPQKLNQFIREFIQNKRVVHK
ncbi:alpha/beta fold hydrolase [Neobacillus massiliamazoniensis]|nr:alpha/beta hydrolase [Neobacillus massiliamazoniensis]